MREKTALLLGASGLTGRHCLNFLLDNGLYSRVVILVRSRLNIDSPRLQQEVVDFNFTGAMEKFYEGVDDVFCCLCTDLKNAGSASILRRVNFHIPVEAANIASERGVSQFLAVSTTRADNHSSEIYKRVKGEMEKALKQFSFESLQVFRPFDVTDIENVNGDNEGFLKKILGSYAFPSDSYDKPIAPETLAKAMVNVAQFNKKGRFYYNSDHIMDLSQGKDSLGEKYRRHLAEI